MPKDRGWNVYPREGRWIVSYRVAPGDWRDRPSRAGGSPHEAPEQSVRGARIDDLRAGKVSISQEATRGPTLRGLSDDWLRLLRTRVETNNIKASTLRGHETNLETLRRGAGEDAQDAAAVASHCLITTPRLVTMRCPPRFPSRASAKPYIIASSKPLRFAGYDSPAPPIG
jgi:hypothetical protein